MKFKISSEPILFIYAFNYATWLAIIPQIILHKVCLQRYGNATLCNNIIAFPEYQLNVQKESSLWQMSYFLLVNIISVFSLSILGPVTDQIGRKKGFIFVALAMVSMNIVMALNSYFMHISPGYLLFSAAISSLFGDLSGVILLSYSDMADITKNNHVMRTMRMSIQESSIFFAFGIGGISSGYLISYFGFISIPIVNIILALFILIYIIVWMPSERETEQKIEAVNLLSKEDSGQFISNNEEETNFNPESPATKISWSLLNPYTHVKLVFNVYKMTGCSVLMLVFFAYFTAMFTITGDGYLLPLYLKNAPFNVSPQLLGYLMGLHGFVGGFGAVVGGVLSYRFNFTDECLLFIGISGQIFTYSMVGIARSLPLVLVGRAAVMTHPLVSSTFRSFMTKIAGVDNQHGSILSAMEIIDVFGGVSASFLLLCIYKSTLQLYSGIVYFVLASISMICLFVIFVVWLRNRQYVSKSLD